MPTRRPGRSVRDFVHAFGADWFTRMSGPWSVPFAAGAVYFPQTWVKVIFGALAAVCLVAGAYFVWRRERIRVLELSELARSKLELVVDRDCARCTENRVNMETGEYEFTVSVGLRNSSMRTLRGVELVLLSLKNPNGDPVVGLATPAIFADKVGELHPGAEVHTAHVRLVTLEITHLGPMRLHTVPSDDLDRVNFVGRFQARAENLSPTEMDFEVDFGPRMGVAPILRLSNGMETTPLLGD
jgi:hypothetical protein